MHLNFENTKNTRDLGGMGIDLSHRTSYHKVIRSDVPMTLTEEEIAYLKRKKITTVLDLRDQSHTELSPTCLQQNQDFKWYSMPLQKEKMEMNSDEDLVKVYLSFADNEEEMKKVFQVIANTDDGVLIHCQEGKDRTGVVVALLLQFLGVSKEDIIADYQSTQVYMDSYIRQILVAFPDFPEYRYATKASYLEAFFEKFAERYGDVPSYLQKIGLSQEEMESIKKKMIEEFE